MAHFSLKKYSKPRSTGVRKARFSLEFCCSYVVDALCNQASPRTPSINRLQRITYGIC